MMEKDIVPKLLETIEKEFDEKTLSSSKIKKALRSLKDNKATYEDANEFAIEVGEILSDVLSKNITVNILPDGKIYYNIADRILNPTMSKNYNLISDFATDIQTELNHQAGLGIKGQKAKLNQDRIDGIIERLSNANNFDDIKWILGEPMVNFSQSIVDDTAKANIEFQDKVGLNPKITRVVVGDCCDWCRQIAGTYKKSDAPYNIYQRHRYCRCRVEYDPGSGKIHDVTTRKKVDPDKAKKIEARKKIGIKEK